MFTCSERKLLGFLKLDLGGVAVRVPVRAASTISDEIGADRPLVILECEGASCEIVVRGDTESEAVGEAMRGVVQQAVRHLSRKLLS